MAKVELFEFQKSLSGKIRKSDNAYFMTRNGQTYLCHRDKKRTTPYSANELERMQLFAAVNKETAALLADPDKKHNLEMMWRMTGRKKHHTLRGYVMSELYKRAAEELKK